MFKKKLIPKKKKALVSQIKWWWHRIDLGDGIVTPGFTPLELHSIISSSIPVSLSGKTILDVGAWDGYYSFLCERRGARVTAIDRNPGHVKSFNIVKKILRSKVTCHVMDLFDLPKRIHASFDIILFFGVLYHLKDPLGALHVLSSFTKSHLIIESHYIEHGNNIPLMRFYPGSELASDPGNWWGPNVQCIIDMCRVAGFREVTVIKKFHARFHGFKNALCDDSRVIIKAVK